MTSRRRPAKPVRDPDAYEWVAADAAAELTCSEQTVRDLAEAGRLPHQVKPSIGRKRKVRMFRPRDVWAYRKSLEVAGVS